VSGGDGLVACGALEEPEDADGDGGERGDRHETTKPAYASATGALRRHADEGGEGNHGDHGPQAVRSQVKDGVSRAQCEGREDAEKVGTSGKAVKGAHGESGMSVAMRGARVGRVGLHGAVHMDVNMLISIVFMDVGMQALGESFP